CDPIESPSGRECEEITKRRRARIASTMAGSSGLVVIIVAIGGSAGGRGARVRGAVAADLVEQLLDPVLAGDRLVVDELELGDALQAQARADLAAQERNRAMERAVRALTRLVVTERGVVHARVLQVG